MNLPRISDPSSNAHQQSLAHLDTLTKPPGSLGRLEEIASWYAAAKSVFPPPSPNKATMLVFASDHGVVKEGVTAYPQSVTTAMVANILQGGAAINTLTTRFGIDLHLYDIGVADPLLNMPQTEAAFFHRKKIREGTRNILVENAMTREEAELSLQTGIEAANLAMDDGAEVLGIGEMGIGNTTAAACLTCAFTGAKPELTVGRGTGIDDHCLAVKTGVVTKALDRLWGDCKDPIDVLASMGGYEFGAMAGVMLAAASRRTPIVLDGFLTNASALIANAIDSGVRHYLLASHQSVEPGAVVALERLNLQPLFNLNMRLGEGTGAALAIDLLRTALHVQNNMATFESANIDGPV